LDRPTKEKIAAELHEKIRDTRMAVLAEYSGLNVEKMTALRNALRKNKSEVKVVKNTLLRIASKDTGVGILEKHFKGPIALVLNQGGDIVETAKVLVDFTKKNNELELMVGVLDGKILTREQVGALAELPGREVLLARLLSVMLSIQTSLVTVLSAIPRSLVQVLEAHRAKIENAN